MSVASYVQPGLLPVSRFIGFLKVEKKTFGDGVMYAICDVLRQQSTAFKALNVSEDVI